MPGALERADSTSSARTGADCICDRPARATEIGRSDWEAWSDWEPGLLPFPKSLDSAVERKQCRPLRAAAPRYRRMET